VSVGDIAAMILNEVGIEGVTFSGGEPMTQALPLAQLAERLLAAGLTVVCYTGYTLEAIRARQDSDIDRLLAAVDLLIDGPFIREQAAPLLWRGSVNQRIHVLTSAYRHLDFEREMSATAYQMELTVRNEGFAATGIWPQGFWDRLAEVLNR